jgi:hypothetical protein
MTKRTATYTLEIELDLSGEYSPSVAATGPSYASGGDPPEDEMIEDLDIEGIGIVQWDALRASSRWVTKSILEGVDRKSETYQQIVRNILALVQQEAEEALMGAGE